MSYSDEDQPFVQLLKSMGIDHFDPLVPVALNEYAARFAAEILKDAKDYSSHAGRSEIYPEDIKLAVKMNDACAVGVDARGSVANKVRDQLQKKSLTELADPRSVQNRYPAEMFMQRSHTYVPGGEVYLEEDMVGNGDDEEQEGSAEHSSRMDVASAGPATTSTNSGGAVKFSTLSKSAAKRLDNAPGFMHQDS